jgi:hypothetical protein
MFIFHTQSGLLALAMLSALMFPMHFSVFKGQLTDNLTTGCIQQDWTVCPTQGKLKDFLRIVHHRIACWPVPLIELYQMFSCGTQLHKTQSISNLKEGTHYWIVNMLTCICQFEHHIQLCTDVRNNIFQHLMWWNGVSQRQRSEPTSLETGAKVMILLLNIWDI